jgi:hypothetical protein
LAGLADPAHQRADDQQAGEHHPIRRAVRLEGDGGEAEAGGVRKGLLHVEVRSRLVIAWITAVLGF